MSRLAFAVLGPSLVAFIGLGACRREPPPAPSKEPEAAVAPSPLKGPVTFRAAVGRVVAVGDLHGDLKAAMGAFRLARLIDESEQWIGGTAVVVQTGDVTDRGHEERALLDWLDKMEERAAAKGGGVYRLNGNHEVMNVAGDLRYVSESGFRDFADVPGALPATLASEPESKHGRYRAFLPGGPWAKKLSRYPIVLVVGDSVFVHGGLRPEHVDYGLERMNAEYAAWMRGDAALPQALQSDASPIWIRDYGDEADPSECAALEVTLTRLKAKRLVIGHTPQKGGITFACDGKVARIDVGLASAYGNRAPTVLEIQGGKVAVLDADKQRRATE